MSANLKRLLYYPRSGQFVLAAKAIAEQRGYKFDSKKWAGHDTRMAASKGMVFLPRRKTFGWGPICEWGSDIEVSNLDNLVACMCQSEL